MAALYKPVLTYDPITDPTGRRANHYQVERSRDGFVFEALADPLTGTATPFYRGDSLIIATAGKQAHKEHPPTPTPTSLSARSGKQAPHNKTQPTDSELPIPGSYRHEMFCYPGPRSSYAVFLGPSNPLNDHSTSLVAPPGNFLSLQRGDVTGAVVALKTVVHMLEKGMLPFGELRRVIFKTDSEYVALGCTERMGTWLRKGW